MNAALIVSLKLRKSPRGDTLSDPECLDWNAVHIDYN